jgi:hypothetical protein
LIGNLSGCLIHALIKDYDVVKPKGSRGQPQTDEKTHIVCLFVLHWDWRFGQCGVRGSSKKLNQIICQSVRQICQSSPYSSGKVQHSSCKSVFFLLVIYTCHKVRYLSFQSTSFKTVGMHVPRLKFRRELGILPLALLFQYSCTQNISLCHESHFVTGVVMQWCCCNHVGPSDGKVLLYSVENCRAYSWRVVPRRVLVKVDQSHSWADLVSCHCW